MYISVHGDFVMRNSVDMRISLGLTISLGICLCKRRSGDYFPKQLPRDILTYFKHFSRDFHTYSPIKLY